MRAAPRPNEPDVVSHRELDRLLALAAAGVMESCNPVGEELGALIDRVAETQLLTPELRAEAHRLRDREETLERLRIARKHASSSPTETDPS